MMDYLAHLAIAWLIIGVAATSVDVLAGRLGILSLGHAGLVGVGAYAGALLSIHVGGGFFSVAAMTLAAGGSVSGLLGWVTSNQRGDYVVLSTLAFGLVVVSLMRNLTGVTGGARGLASIPRPHFGPWSVEDSVGFLLLYGVAAAILLVGYVGLTKSRLGLVAHGMRDDEVFVASLGHRTRLYRIGGFALSGSVATLGGALYAQYYRFIDPQQFGVLTSATLLAIVLLGGSGRMLGPWIGSGFFVILPELLRFLGLPGTLVGPGRQAIFGALLVAVALRRGAGSEMHAPRKE